MAYDVTTVMEQGFDVALAFDLLFKSFDVGMAVNVTLRGICVSENILVFFLK
jgi:hypothetical protein